MDERTDEIILRVENLKQYFGNPKKPFKGVDGVSFSVKKGEAFGIVGESGSGKTTTGRAIIGLYAPTDGEIYFNGKLIGAGKPSATQRAELKKNAKERLKIQMIFQDPVASLNPRMTVKEIVAEGLIVNGIRDKKTVEEKVYHALETVGLLKEHAGRYPHEFSGGQRQRIGIARALITNPQVLIADEPVSALDVSVQAQVVNLLADLKEKLGLTVLFIAHDLSVVKYFSDRIAVMYLGKIVELASSKELFENPLHPYTKALLSAIPLPDPRTEKGRESGLYEPSGERTGQSLLEVKKGHFLLREEREGENS